MANVHSPGYRPREIKLYLPNGSSLPAAYFATRLGGEHVYQVHCVDQTTLLRDFVKAMPPGEKRAKLLKVLDLDLQDPTLILPALVEGRNPRQDGGFDLQEHEVTAVIVQSRAINYLSRIAMDGEYCRHCQETASKLFSPAPFTECADLPLYSERHALCANCIWADCACVDFGNLTHRSDKARSTKPHWIIQGHPPPSTQGKRYLCDARPSSDLAPPQSSASLNDPRLDTRGLQSPSSPRRTEQRRNDKFPPQSDPLTWSSLTARTMAPRHPKYPSQDKDLASFKRRIEEGHQSFVGTFRSDGDKLNVAYGGVTLCEDDARLLVNHYGQIGKLGTETPRRLCAAIIAQGLLQKKSNDGRLNPKIMDNGQRHPFINTIIIESGEAFFTIDASKVDGINKYLNLPGRVEEHFLVKEDRPTRSDVTTNERAPGVALQPPQAGGDRRPVAGPPQPPLGARSMGGRVAAAPQPWVGGNPMLGEACATDMRSLVNNIDTRVSNIDTRLRILGDAERRRGPMPDPTNRSEEELAQIHKRQNRHHNNVQMEITSLQFQSQGLVSDVRGLRDTLNTSNDQGLNPRQGLWSQTVQGQPDEPRYVGPQPRARIGSGGMYHQGGSTSAGQPGPGLLAGQHRATSHPADAMRAPTFNSQPTTGASPSGRTAPGPFGSQPTSRGGTHSSTGGPGNHRVTRPVRNLPPFAAQPNPNLLDEDDLMDLH